MAISKVVVVDGNNLIVRIDRGVAGRGVTDVEPIEIDGSLYLVFTFSDGTTETVGPVGTIQYIGQTPIVVTGSTISLSTVPVNLGGTGQTTANAGFNALAPTQTGNAGKYLKTDGTNSAWDLLDISTADITGVLPIANGGTNASTASGARTNLGLGTIATQDASAVAITGGSITGITDLAVADGGTGASTAAGAMVNLLPSYTGNANKRLGLDSTASGLEWVTDGGGTVTSVDVSGGTTGLSFTGGPITTSGTITLSGTLDVDNGGTGATTAAGARTNLNAADQALTLTAGTGLSGGGDLTANRSFSIANTGVTAASYGAASKTLTATVNAQGQLTALADTDIAISNTQISGLGTMSTQNANAVAITGGSITGITDLAVADGGTGASTAADARTNLGAAASATTISAGTGLSGGGDLTANRTLSIANTAVTAGSYGTASDTLTATVNAQGQLTALAATPIAISNTQISGLGTMSTQNSNAVTITGGSITGITDLAIADGGTGASNAADARSNLGLGTAAVLNAGVANGVATLDAGGTVPLSQIPASIQGGVSYQGAWNASTNTPTLTSSVGTKGHYYVVSVAGNTNLNGVTDWLVGDWAIYNGTAWEKIDNTDQVASVNGYTGVVVLTNTDVGAPSTSLTISAGTGLSGGGNLTTNRTLSIANTAVSAGSYGTASAVPSFTVNGQGQLTAASDVTIAISNAQVSGLGTMSTQNANSVAITGGSITGITDLAIADGGTGASTAGGALTNLGAIGTITSTDGSIVVTPSGTTVDLAVSAASPASTLLTQVRNTTGATLTKGTVVYISGATGQIATVSKAIATGDATSAQTLGMITSDLANNSNGYVTVFGLLENMDTSAYTDGAQLYLSGTTAGAVTATKPSAPTHLVYVAVVEYAHPTQGKLLVKVQNGYELDEIHDVSIVSPVTGETLVYNATTDLWVNNTVSLTAGVNGTLPIANGGTGQTTANAAFNALAPSQTGNSGKYLTTDGTNTSWAINAGGDVVGPASSTNNGIALFDGTTGKLLKDSASTDGLIYGLTVGRGAGAVATNTAVGSSALVNNSTGSQNTAFGYQAGYVITTGSQNTAFGASIMDQTVGVTGSENAAFGRVNMRFLTSGSNNTATGNAALNSLTTGSNNTASGYQALASNTTASNNTAVGYQAGYSNTTGTNNNFSGFQSGFWNTTGSQNTAFGVGSYASATTTATGSNNSSFGYQAAYSNTTGYNNVAVGSQALYANTTGRDNSAFGESALSGNTTGSFNAAFGGRNTGSTLSALGSNSTGNYNTALGVAALALNTTASNNTAVGYQAGYANTTGELTAVGVSALANNTTGTNNVGIGRVALANNTTGSQNTALGMQALVLNTTASNNTAVGFQAGYSNTTGSFNLFVGRLAGYSNTTGDAVTAIGNGAAYANTTGTDTTAVGSNALVSNTTGGYNTALGSQSLYSNTTASNNTAVGYQAGYSVTTGSPFTALGYQAGLSTTTAVWTTAIGYQALRDNTTGGNNTAVGRALVSNTTGADNTSVGMNALYYNTTGNYNTAVGASALFVSNTASYGTAIGFQAGYNNTTGKITAVGAGALYSNTTGVSNTAVGGSDGVSVGAALASTTTGSYNVAMGTGALNQSTTASYNTAVGFRASFSNTTGAANTIMGNDALYYNTTGGNNVAIGASALQANTTASKNTAVGYQAGYTNTTGTENTAVGDSALLLNTTGSYLAAVGKGALVNNTTGANNTAMGWNSLANNTTASNNTAVGYQAGYSNTTGVENIFIGRGAGYANVTGNYSVMIGVGAGGASTAGQNTLVGYSAGGSLTSGNYNTIVGPSTPTSAAGYLLTTGSKNTILGGYNGNQGGLDIRTSDNYIVLSDGDGNPRVFVDYAGEVFFDTVTATATAGGNVFLGPTATGGPRLVTGHASGTAGGNAYAQYNYAGTAIGSITQDGTTGVLYNTSSDQRLKENIQDAESASALIDSLQVRQFDWKSDGSHQRYGFVAQELLTVYPEAVHQPVEAEEMMAVDYSKLVPLLVKEIQSLKARLDAANL